jgi:hypothetical protein
MLCRLMQHYFAAARTVRLAKMHSLPTAGTAKQCLEHFNIEKVIFDKTLWRRK